MKTTDSLDVPSSRSNLTVNVHVLEICAIEVVRLLSWTFGNPVVEAKSRKKIT